MKLNTPSHLSDTELVAEVIRLARSEREATFLLINHLAELDARQLYLGAGYPSLFTYCTEVLSLSEHEAYHRMVAARTARRFPQILGLLAEGALNLTTVRLLAPHLTPNNCDTLFAEASRRSKRKVEELVAAHFPRPAVAAFIRKLPEPQPSPSPAATCASRSAGEPDRVPEAPVAPEAILQSLRLSAPPSSPSAGRPALLRPLAPDRYQVTFTATAETCEKLRVAKDLLRHSIPSGDTADIVDRALTVLIEHLARKKFAATPRPRVTGHTNVHSRHIPAAVKRAVCARDGGRCAFVSKTGRRCAEPGFLEFHHLRPYATGGPATVDNIQLRCRAHNAYEAELCYGTRRRDDGSDVVEEARIPYGCRTRRSTRSGPSWRAIAQ